MVAVFAVAAVLVFFVDAAAIAAFTTIVAAAVPADIFTVFVHTFVLLVPLVNFKVLIECLNVICTFSSSVVRSSVLISLGCLPRR